MTVGIGSNNPVPQMFGLGLVNFTTNWSVPSRSCSTHVSTFQVHFQNSGLNFVEMGWQYKVLSSPGLLYQLSENPSSLANVLINQSYILLHAPGGSLIPLAFPRLCAEGFSSGGGGRFAFTGVIDDWIAQSGRPVLVLNFVPATSDSGAKFA